VGLSGAAQLRDPLGIDGLAERFWSDLSSSIRDKVSDLDTPPICLLSGGVDSLLLASIALDIWGSVDTVTFGSSITADLNRARGAAYRLGVDNRIVVVTLDEIMDSLHLVKGKDITSVFMLQFYLTHVLSFAKYDISGRDILQGDWADLLLGSSAPGFTYISTPTVAEDMGITMDEARTHLKIKKFNDSKREINKRSGPMFARIVTGLSGRPVQPYIDDRVAWVNELPYSVSRPDKKLLSHRAMCLHGIDSSGSKKTTMQDGSGIYRALQQRLMDLTGCGTPNSAVASVVRG
jgi:hypothetical protein